MYNPKSDDQYFLVEPCDTSHLWILCGGRIVRNKKKDFWGWCLLVNKLHGSARFQQAFPMKKSLALAYFLWLQYHSSTSRTYQLIISFVANEKFSFFFIQLFFYVAASLASWKVGVQLLAVFSWKNGPLEMCFESRLVFQLQLFNFK